MKIKYLTIGMIIAIASIILGITKIVGIILIINLIINKINYKKLWQ